MSNDEQSDEKLVTVAVCSSSIEGPLLKGYLESHDVYCYIQGDEHRQMLGLVGSYVEPRVMVLSGDAERAAALIDEFRLAVAQPDPDGEDDEEIDEKGLRFAETREGSPYRHPATLESPQLDRKPLRALAAGLLLGAGSGQRYAGKLRASMPFAIIEITGWVLVLTGNLAPVAGTMAIASLRIVDAAIGSLSLHEKRKESGL